MAQLRLVAMGSERLRKCIYDHNRAFAQRSIWQRDRLLEVGELAATTMSSRRRGSGLFLPLGDDDGHRADEADASA